MGSGQSSAQLRVDLSKKGIKDIEKDLKYPHMLPAFSKLQELNLSKNKIVTIPEFINADLDKAPNVIEHLAVLNLAKNKLQEIPAPIFKLMNLRVLNLSYNEIVNVTDKILIFYALEELMLSGNKLKRLPWNIHHLNALKVLRVDDNQITHFPNNIAKMRGLTEFAYLPNPVDPSYEDVKTLEALLSKIGKQKIPAIYRDDAHQAYERDKQKQESLSPDEQVVRRLLKYQEGLDALIRFTKKELSYENLDFYLTVRDFRRKYHSDVEIRSERIIRDAKAIYDKFIADDSPCQVNLPAHATELCKKAFTDAFNYPKGINQWIFSAAYKASFELMVKDTFLRFKLTPEGKELIDLLNEVDRKHRKPTQ